MTAPKRPRAPRAVRHDLANALDLLQSLAGHDGHDRCAIDMDADTQAEVRRFLGSWVLPLVERSHLWAEGGAEEPLT